MINLLHITSSRVCDKQNNKELELQDKGYESITKIENDDKHITKHELIFIHSKQIIRTGRIQILPKREVLLILKQCEKRFHRKYF